ncbi:MAG: hypothetical protein H8D63_00875 [Parcubacteria group bacterium]|nr:hypothetical protein [Parcubacteria group bacterium]
MNSSQQKRIFIWGGTILLIVLLGVGIFLFGRGGNSSEGVGDNGFFGFLFSGAEGEGVLDSLFGSEERDGDSPDKTPQDDEKQLSVDLISQVFPEPVSGATFITLPQSTEGSEEEKNILIVRVIEKATGNIFDIPVDTLGAERITNTTIPHIHDTLWNTDGTEFFARTLNDDDIIEGTGISIFTAEEEGGDIGLARAEFLRTGTLAFDTNPTQDSLFLLERTTSGSRGIIVPFSGEEPKEAFSSPLSEWLIDWAENDYIYLTTKPAAGIPGYSYYLSLFSNTLNPILSGVSGLTTLTSPDGTKILFSESSENTLTLKILSDGEETALLFDTLPEKCTWDAEGKGIYCGVPFSLPFTRYPDTWYKGELFFEDSIWYYDTEESIGFFLVDPNMYDTAIDLINPVLSEDESFLLFTNKRDMTPWILRVADAFETVNY